MWHGSRITATLKEGPPGSIPEVPTPGAVVQRSENRLKEAKGTRGTRYPATSQGQLASSRNTSGAPVRVTTVPWAGQPSGVSPEETAEGPSRGLRGPCCYPNTPRLGPALRLPTGTLRARFSRCSRLQQRHRSLSILSHGRGGEGDDWRLLRLPVLTRSHTSRGAAHASELRRRALPPAFVSAPFFLPLGGSGGGAVHRLPFRLATRPRCFFLFSPFRNSTCLPRLSSNTASSGLSS